MKLVDKATPLLFLKVAEGAHIAEVDIDFAQGTGDHRVFFKIQLLNALLTGVRTNATANGPDARPTEFVTFSFQKIQWTYLIYDAGGNLVGQTVGGWDTAGNTPL